MNNQAEQSEDNEPEPKSLTEIANAAEKRFKEVCPAGMKFGAELSFAFQILQDNPNLMVVAKECPRSLVSVLQNLAAIGLSLSPAKKEAYMLSRNIKIQREGKEVWESRLFLEPSYIGFNKIATDTGAIEWVQAKVVRKEDTCVDNGVGLRVTHDYETFGTNETRGPIVGCYCSAKLPSGDILTKFLNKERLDSIRDRSETWKKSIKNVGDGAGTWLTDEEEMIMKATMRTSFKTWPKSTGMERLEQAVHISNENEGFEPLLTSPEITQYTADQKAYFDQLITKSNAIGMFCFIKSIPVGVYMSLYNSFDKDITKYKKIIDELERSGGAQINDCRAELEEAARNGDDAGVKEIVEDLSKDAIEWIKEQTNDIETRKMIIAAESENGDE